MSTPRINAAFALLQDEVSNCEKALFKLIEMKEKMPEQPMEMPKLPEQPMEMPKKPEKPMDTPMETSQINARLQQTPIAIIGMASLLPESKNLQEYWEKILQKIDCITDVPASRWDVDAYYDPDPRAPDKTYCKRGGFIPDIDFNPMEFGLPPNNVEVTDVSQLLSLVVAKEAMEDAGYGESRKFNRENAGVILGTAMAKQLATPLTARLQYPVWEKVLKSSGLSDEDTQKIVEKIKKAYIQWDENAFPGLLANIISGRIANRLDFGGTNCVVDAACASSLSALSMAISELVEHRADLMITGGVDTDNTAMAYLCFSKTPAVSKGDKVKPFDADSDGMMLGEGIGMIVIKRLEDAVRDNDRIYAVIKGVGTSSDGRYKSIYAPRPEGQIRALRRAYEDAGFSPTSVTLVEAHGTGTMIGDPTEFSALKEFFSENNDRSQYIAIGSVKSQIGHTKAAAGAASLIKTALALHHKVLPPTINVTKPHPKLQIETSPFYLNTETRPWIRAEGEAPRRAGVSSFGFGGTNFHIVLEEYEGEHQKAYRVHNTAQSVLLSAPTPAELLARCEEMLLKLQSEEKEQHYKELIETCQSLEIPVTHARVGFVADSLTQACKFIQTSIDGLKKRIEDEAWQHPQGIHYRKTGMDLNGKVVALFSGQGSQYPEMGRELAINFPYLRQVYGYMDSLFVQDKMKPVSEAVFPQPVFDPAQKEAQAQMLQRTEYAQPAIGALSVGLYKILQQAGFKPDFVAGHSFGELTALWAAEALRDEDYFSLVKARGQAMATPDDPSVDVGTMLAVTGDALQVEDVIKQYPQVNIANFNSNKQIVLAGVKSELVKVQQTLTEKGASTVWLPVSAAFHTPLVGHAQKPFAKAVDAVTFQKPKVPVFTNVTGNCYPAQPELMSKVLKEHLINPVLFKREIENIYGQGGYCFIEFGPRSVLTHLVKEILSDRPHVAVALNASRQKDSDRQLREAAVQLRVAGLPLKNLDPFQLEQKLPTVPKSKLLNIRLGASNHVSEKTRKAFEDALQDDHQVKLTPAPAEPKQPLKEVAMGTNGNGITDNSHIDPPRHSVSPSPRLLPRVNTTEHEALPVTQPIMSASGSNTVDTAQAKPTQPMAEPTMPSKPEMPLHYHQRVLESLEYTLAQFNQQQGGLLQVHEQSLHHQMEYIKAFFQLTQQQNVLFGDGQSALQQEATNFVVQESSERSMMRFHDHQAETLRVHEQFLSDQMEHLTSLFQFMQQQYSSVLMNGSSPVNGNFTVNVSSTPTNGNSTPTNRHSTPTNGSSTYERLMSTQLAANIASQQYNGNGNGNGKSNGNGKGKGHPELVTAKDTVVTELNSSALLTTVPTVLASELVINPEQPSSNGSKTVEETQAVYTQPKAEVINLEPVKSNGAIAVQESETVSAQPESAVMVATPSVAIDLSTLGSTLIAIVSEKTGYPAEMLELEMDMEADLGIDSIKRVEILGGLQELYPDMPKPDNLEELAALRTLGQIAEYMQNLGQGSAQAQPASMQISSTVEVQQPVAVMPIVSSNGVTAVQETVIAVAEPAVAIAPPLPVVEPEVTVTVASPSPVASDFSNLGSTLLSIVSEKTGYPAEMLELEMDMEADLGIDSIKRVEILGALQELYPNLPKPAAENLEELAALRTLGQIAEYMEKQGTELSEKKTPSAQLVSSLA